MQSPWLVVFDLDGTLIDSSRDLCQSVNAALAHVGRTTLSQELIASYVGDGAAMLVRRALASTHVTGQPGVPQRQDAVEFERTFEYFLEYYRHHKLDNTKVYEGVLGALASMREASPELLMAVLTNKPVRPSREICEALGIAPYLFVTYGGDSFPTKKPDALGLRQIIAEARMQRGFAQSTRSSSGVIMVGDSEVDVLTAHDAGVKSLGCLYGLSPAGLKAAKPDLLCSSPVEWPSLLGLLEALV